MDVLYGLSMFIFVIICILLMGIILLQSSKTGGMGTAMGGAAINTAFGGQGADKLLVRITTALAITFMSLALIIGIMNPASTSSVDGLPTGNSSGAETNSLSEDTFDNNSTATESSNNKNEKSLPGNLINPLNEEKESLTKGKAK